DQQRAFESVKKLVVTWLNLKPVGDDVLRKAATALHDIPGITDEIFKMAINDTLVLDDPHESKVDERLWDLVKWDRLGERRAQTPFRRRLLGDFYSPFCQNKDVIRKYGDTLQQRLDQAEVGNCNIDPIVDTCPREQTPHSEGNSRVQVGYPSAKTAAPAGTCLQNSSVVPVVDDGLDSLGLRNANALLFDTITRKDISEGRRLAQSIDPIVYSGTGDDLPYVVFKRRFDLLCRQNGLIGDP
ncbi:hypothetical protein FOL47_004673, partial [Perkinsus chesapeaki]